MSTESSNSLRTEIKVWKTEVFWFLFSDQQIIYRVEKNIEDNLVGYFFPQILYRQTWLPTHTPATGAVSKISSKPQRIRNLAFLQKNLHLEGAWPWPRLHVRSCTSQAPCETSLAGPGVRSESCSARLTALLLPLLQTPLPELHLSSRSFP